MVQRNDGEASQHETHGAVYLGVDGGAYVPVFWKLDDGRTYSQTTSLHR